MEELQTDYSPNIQNSKTSKASAASSSGASSNIDMLSALQNQLMNQTGRISSSQTNIESVISNAIRGVQEANEKSKSVIESQAERARQNILDTGGNALTGAREGQKGFATNVGVLKKINDSVNAELKDLEQRKWETLQSGDAETAGKIAELQLKSLEYRQQAEQNVFNNLLAMTNMTAGLVEADRAQARFDTQERRLQQAQDFAERQALNAIALEYGVEVVDGDTLESVVNKVKPFVSEERQLKLDNMRADLERTKAETAKALRGDRVLDPSVILALSRASYHNNELLGLMDGDTAMASIANWNNIDKEKEEELSNAVYGFIKANPSATKGEIASYLLKDAPVDAPSHVYNTVLSSLGQGEFSNQKKPKASKSSTKTGTKTGSSWLNPSSNKPLFSNLSYEQPKINNSFLNLLGDF